MYVNVTPPTETMPLYIVIYIKIYLCPDGTLGGRRSPK